MDAATERDEVDEAEPVRAPLRAMVLAAGMGSRLGALSDELPKPLLPVCDVAIIRYGLALLAGHGTAEVAINLHHLGARIVAELDGSDGKSPPDVAIAWSREETILGTGGGVVKAADWLTRGGGESFLVMNGKLILDADLDALVERHRQSGAAATMLVREVEDAARWGAVDVDEHGRVLRILDDGMPGVAARRTMFTGVHVVSPALVARLPPSGESCIIRKGYQPLLRDGARVEAVLHDGYFEEHSTPRRYLDGNLAVLRGEAKLRFPPRELAVAAPSRSPDISSSAELRQPVLIADGARVEAGAIVGPDVVVGRGATVAANVRVRRAVLWPGCRLGDSAEDVVVTPRGVFPVAGA